MKADVMPIPLIYSALLIATIGVFGNLTICLITLKYKSLHTRCYILIGILAFFDFIVCIHLVHTRIMMALEMYFLRNSTCFYHTAYGIFAMSMQSAMGLFLGVDRLLNVSIPIKYPRIPLKFYAVMFVFCFCFAGSITVYGYILTSDQLVLGVCIVTTALNGPSHSIWLWANFTIVISVVIIYGFAYAGCHYLKDNGRHMRTMAAIDRILNSLVVIVGLYVCTWFSAITVLFMADILKAENEVTMSVNRWAGWFVVCNSSFHVFVYFWRTPEYRRAICRFYGFSKETDKGARITPVRTGIHNNNSML